MTAPWARRRRERFRPDDRPDWRDPDMPALVWAAYWSDGKQGWRLLSPTQAQAIARLRLDDPREKV